MEAGIKNRVLREMDFHMTGPYWGLLRYSYSGVAFASTVFSPQPPQVSYLRLIIP